MPDDDTDDLSTDTEPAPADAFALVGHEIRAEIIQELGKDPAELELAFGELRSRMDTDVEPSQLHYHLQQLVGHFVEKTEGGYALSPAGTNLSLALHAGAFDSRQERLSVDADVDCYYCQGSIETHFKDGWVLIECSECNWNYGIGFLGVPFEVFEDATAALAHASKYTAIQTVFFAYGVCPSCRHPLGSEFHAVETDRDPRNVHFTQPCALCGALWVLPVGRALLTDPELIAFGYDHGVDILSIPHWELEFAATDKHLTVRSTEPWKVALEVTFDGDTLEVVVDGDLNVVERNRSSASGLGQIILPDKTACLEALRSHRWPDRVTCPHCNSTDTIKKGTNAQDAQRYRCNGCNSRFNDLTGTIFADRNLSLPEMFHIIRAVEEPDPAQIARQIDRSREPVVDFMNTVLDASDAEADVDLSAIGTAAELYETVDEHWES